MSDLVISVFDDEITAEEARLNLLKRQKEHILDLEDAIVLVRTRDDKVKLHHITHLTLGGAVGGGFLGTLMGIMLLNPLFAAFGMAAGTVVGAVTGSLSHLGIDEAFMKDFAAHLKPGTSALCVLVREHLDEALKEIERLGGKMLQACLLHEDEKELHQAFASIRCDSEVQPK